MKLLLGPIRWIVGILFIFSGLVKANDPLGLSYKMQEFFEVWGVHQFHDFTLALSVLMIVFEIVAGVAVIIGWRMRLFSWLLLLLILFFTFLTAYANFSGKIKTCGCFGDCIPLTSNQSFWKDILLTILIALIFIYRSQIKPLITGKSAFVWLILTTFFSFGIQFYVLKYQPIIDCLPYKVGNNIEENMKIPPGAIPDSIVINFVYNKGGQEVEFSADEFPEDFDEASYSFVKRYDKVVRKGNAEPPIKDFSLRTLSNNDTTDAVLQHPGYTLLFFAQNVSTPVSKWAAIFKEIQTTAALRNIPTLIVTADAENMHLQLTEENIEVSALLKCDAVAIKTAARTNPTLYLIRNGVIDQKWGRSDLRNALNTLKKIEGI